VEINLRAVLKQKWIGLLKLQRNGTVCLDQCKFSENEHHFELIRDESEVKLGPGSRGRGDKGLYPPCEKRFRTTRKVRSIMYADRYALVLFSNGKRLPSPRPGQTNGREGAPLLVNADEAQKREGDYCLVFHYALYSKFWSCVFSPMFNIWINLSSGDMRSNKTVERATLRHNLRLINTSKKGIFNWNAIKVKPLIWKKFSPNIHWISGISFWKSALSRN